MGTYGTSIVTMLEANTWIKQNLDKREWGTITVNGDLSITVNGDLAYYFKQERDAGYVTLKWSGK